MDDCRDPCYVMKHLGMLYHPSVLCDVAPGCIEQHPLLTKIVYRQDLHSQFQDFVALRRFLDDNGANVDDGGHPIPKLDTGRCAHQCEEGEGCCDRVGFDAAL